MSRRPSSSHRNRLPARVDFDLWWLLDPGALLRPGLDRRAHRHQAPVARVARAAALVFQRAQFSAQRAARQGDRVVHRSGEGRSADGRPALCARLVVSPPGRNRSGDPHAPEPARPFRPVGRQARDGHLRTGAGFPARGPAGPRRGIADQARRHVVRACIAGPPDRHLRTGEGLAEGHRRQRSGWRRWPSNRTSRKSRNTTANLRQSDAEERLRDRAAEYLDKALAEYKAVRARDHAAGRHRARAARSKRTRPSPPGRRSSRRIPRSSRWPPSASPRPTASSTTARPASGSFATTSRNTRRSTS